MADTLQNQTTDVSPKTPVTMSPSPTIQTEAAIPAMSPAGHTSRDHAPLPTRPGKVVTWMLMLGCLTIGAAPMLMDIQRQRPWNGHEQTSVAISLATWRHLHRLPIDSIGLEALTPIYQDQPYLATAPGTTWIHLAAFSLNDSPTLAPSQAILAGRLASAILGLAALLAIFWTGFSVGGLGTACFATLVCLATAPFIYAGRLASGIMPELAFGLISIAAAVWSIRPLRPTASLVRQGLGWMTCGLALGVAALIAGPTAFVSTLLPILIILLLCPHRISHLLGMVAAACIATLIVTPWVVYALDQNPEVWKRWLADLGPNHVPVGTFWKQAGIRILLVLTAVMPWTLWLIAALIQPFSASSSGTRMRLFLGWAWFVTITTWILIRPDDTTIRILAPALPAAAILIGQLFQQFADLSAEGRHARTWRILRWPHVMALLAASISLPLALNFQDSLMEREYLDGLLTATMHGSYWFGAGVVLVSITMLSLHWASKHYPGRTLIAWSVWTVTAFIVLLIPMVRGPVLDTTVSEPLDTTAAVNPAP